MRYILIFILVAVLSSSINVARGQIVSEQDTVFVEKDKNAHSPRKATLYSAILPGLGQIYNKKYWKVPIVYGGFVGFSLSIDYWNGKLVLYKQAYSDITDSDPRTNAYLDLEAAQYFDTENNASDRKEFSDRLEKARDGARRYRDLNIIGTVVFYAINIIDASVDAHFFDFDISEDLSMIWTPQTMYCMDTPVVGFRCRLTF